MVYYVVTGFVFEMYASLTYIITRHNDPDLNARIFPDRSGNPVIGMTVRMGFDFFLFTEVPDDVEEMMDS